MIAYSVRRSSGMLAASAEMTVCTSSRGETAPRRQVGSLSFFFGNSPRWRTQGFERMSSSAPAAVRHPPGTILPTLALGPCRAERRHEIPDVLRSDLTDRYVAQGRDDVVVDPASVIGHGPGSPLRQPPSAEPLTVARLMPACSYR